MSTSPYNMQPDGSGLDASPHVDAFLADVAQFERRAAVDVVAGEVGHEIAHTLSFLRVFVEDAAEAGSLSSEDSTIARREIERLAQMMGHLRRLKLSPPVPTPVPLGELVRRAVAAVNATASAKQIQPSVSLLQNVTLLAEPSLVYILVRDMLGDIVRRGTQPGTVEVLVALPSGQSDGSLDVWGSTAEPSRRAEPDDDRFDLWSAANDQRGYLGLAVAHRIARVLGWKLDSVNDDRREGLRLVIPAAAFRSESS